MTHTEDMKSNEKTLSNAIHNEMDQGHDFDIIVNDGRDIKGYRNVNRH